MGEVFDPQAVSVDEAAAVAEAPSFRGTASIRACRTPSPQVWKPERRRSARRKTHLGEHVNGWQVTLDMGRYGTRYAYRAAWTFLGVGGNLIEDACYPLATTDGDGEPLDSSHRYTLRFSAMSSRR
jgi:hypothetical protein